MRPHGGSARLVARVAGLPCGVVDGFSSGLGGLLEALDRSAAALARTRTVLVDRLYSAIGVADPHLRRALLAVKRDCYNGRPLRALCGTETWGLVAEAVGPIAATALALERDLDAATEAFGAAHEAEARRQHGYLASFVDEPSFRTGLASASSLVASGAARLRNRSPESYGRRERRLATTLLRYASRAALKVSPFSTLTPVALARVAAGTEALTFVDTTWQQHSLVRLRRYVLDRCADLLLGYTPWRGRLVVAMNESAVALPEGRLLFRRPSHWRPDETSRTLRYHEEALVRVRVQGDLVDGVGALLASRTLTYADLLRELGTGLGPDRTDAEIRTLVDRLIEIGFLHLIAPWANDDAYLERTMARELRRLGADTGLASVAEILDRLVTVQEGAMDAADPASAFGEMAQLIQRLTETAAALGGVSPDIDVQGSGAARDVYQDVWCAPRHGEREALLRIGRSALDEALRSAQPLMRYARLWDRRLEFLYTLGALLRRARGGEGGLALLEAFEAVQPAWQSFMTLQVQRRKEASFRRGTWNPLGLPLLEELAAWRDAAHAGLDACLVDGPEGRRISVDALEAVLRPIPERFTDPHVGACLFLQPAAADGSLWMLNRMKEGTGRYASRYTPVMPPALARRYAAGMRLRGRLQIDGEPVELLDIQCIQGDTLNVHAPQTPKVLTLPGASSDLPAGRRRSLGDLVVAVGDDGWPQLRDRAGQRYLPVYLGVAYHDYLPTMVKFLCSFGPSEMGAVFPDRLEREGEGVVACERTLIGNLVLQRRSWRVPVAELRRMLAAAPSSAFAGLHRWRVRHGIPERLFAIEHVPHPSLKALYKPQYIDLSSPLFLELLRAIVAGTTDPTLTLQETLPSPDAFPEDVQGRRWAVELLVDSLSLQPARRGRTRAGGREIGGLGRSDRRSTPISAAAGANEHDQGT